MPEKLDVIVVDLPGEPVKQTANELLRVDEQPDVMEEWQIAQRAIQTITNNW